MVGGRITVTQISESGARTLVRAYHVIDKFSKCSATAGLVGAATSAAINYFGGPEYAEAANRLFQYSMVAMGTGLALPLVARQFGGMPMGKAVEDEEAKLRQPKQGLLNKIIF